MTHRDDLAARVAAAQALAAAATPGPYRLEVAATPPGETPWGEVVLRHHPAGGTGTPIPGLRVMWQGRATMGQGWANASLLAAAPDLAALVAELWAAVEQERADLSRAWECVGEERARAEMAEAERDEARAEVARLRAMLPDGGPTWGEHIAGLADDLPTAPEPARGAAVLADALAIMRRPT